ncbi:MAG: hemerythrin domain-containing protein [Acidimicrobiales bacterium]
MSQSLETVRPVRIDLYREVHKGLRLALFDLVSAAGALDAADVESVSAFTDLFADVDMMLETHHSHEDGAALGALIREHAVSVVSVVDEAHETSEQRLLELRSMVAALCVGEDKAHAIYDAVVAFTADYLVHMDVEEKQIMPLLQDSASGEELMEITMAIRTSVPPADMCVFLRYMLPAMNLAERTATLGGMKVGAPPEIFDLFWGVAEESLSASALEAVADRIAA